MERVNKNKITVKGGYKTSEKEICAPLIIT